jgi:hypothetical protein
MSIYLPLQFHAPKILDSREIHPAWVELCSEVAKFLMKEDNDMYTSILLVALSGLVAPMESTEAPAWLTDYSKASQIVARANKPLAVFLGDQADNVSRDGRLSSEAKQFLADNYVCLHIDTATAQGKDLAGAFDMPGGLGIVISDRTGKIQAFRHEGNLDNSTLVTYLVRYADPQLVIRTTESNPERVSNYPPSEAPASGYCPTCSSCSGGRCRR